VASIFSYYQTWADFGIGRFGHAPGPHEFLTSYCSVDAAGNSYCDGFLSGSAAGQQVVNLCAPPSSPAWTLPWRRPASRPLPIVWLPARRRWFRWAVSQRRERGWKLRGGDRRGRGWLHRHSGSQPGFRQIGPEFLFERFFRAGRDLEGYDSGVVRFTTTQPSTRRFLAGAVSQPPAVMQAFTLDVVSPSGACGQPVTLWDAVDSSGNPPAGGPLATRLLACDGLLAQYQIDIGTSAAFQAFVTDLAQEAAHIMLRATPWPVTAQPGPP